MLMKAENKNFMYNIIYQLFLYIVPLILTPYISRVLGANNIGIYSYTYSIVYYFMLFTMLGINNYGSRNIAKLSKNKEEYSKKFWSIYSLQLILGMFMFLLYNLFHIFIIKKYSLIFMINNFFLLSAIFDINWFYFGLEKFKITIVRNTIIKVCSLFCVFTLVKTNLDLWKYTLIMSLSTLISQLYLFFILHKYIYFRKVSKAEIFSNLKECMVLFIPVLAYSIYRVMDKTMIGTFSSTLELGYYENAEKIINIPVSLITALGTVMLPHMSKIEKKNRLEIKKEINASIKLCMCFVVPIVVGLLIVGKDFAIVYFGQEFEKSGIIIMLLSFTILFSGVANVIRTNYLIPFELDKIYVTSTILGAIMNLIANIIFIPKYGSLGACIGTILAEFMVMFYQFVKVKNDVDSKYIIKCIVNYICKSIFIVIPLIAVKLLISNLILRIIIQVVISVIIYFAINYNYIIYEFLGVKKNDK